MQVNSNTRRKNRAFLPWDVALFFALYIILPEYFALEISESFPLLTGNRILLVLLGIMWLLRNRSILLNPKEWNLGLTDDKFLRCSIFIYLALLAVCNLATLGSAGAESIKALLVLVAEEYVLVWLITFALNSRQKILSAVKILVIASGVVGLIATVGCVIGYNPFHLLYTASRDMLHEDYYRLGMLRAAAGFGHPVFYGAYCVVITPLNMYLADNAGTKGKKVLYCACLVMNLVGMFFSNSRGSFIIFAVMAVLLFIVYLLKKNLKKLFLNYLPVVIAALLVILLVVQVSSIGTSFLASVANSITQSFQSDETDSTELTDFTDETDATEEDLLANYGTNKNGMNSRTLQLSGILWTLQREPLFGFGSNAHIRGLLCYEIQPGVWHSTKTVDVGYVAIIGQYGLVGTLGYIALFGSLFFTIILKKRWKDELMLFLGLSFVAYLLSLLSVAHLSKYLWVLIGLILSMVNIMKKESEAETVSEPALESVAAPELEADSENCD